MACARKISKWSERHKISPYRLLGPIELYLLLTKLWIFFFFKFIPITPLSIFPGWRHTSSVRHLTSATSSVRQRHWSFSFSTYWRFTSQIIIIIIFLHLLAQSFSLAHGSAPCISVHRLSFSGQSPLNLTRIRSGPRRSYIHVVQSV